MPLIVGGIVLAMVVAWLVWRSNNAMWTIQVRDGQVTSVSGPAPIGFVSAVREVVANPPVRSATISARRAEHGAVLDIRGVHDGQRQRLQNVFRLQPQSVLRSGPSPVNEQNMRQAFWIAWLLSLFRR